VRRIPIGLTITSILAFAVLIGLGVWQVHRLAWKQDLLARVAALRGAPARPIGEILHLAARGQDVEYRRVKVDCLAPVASTRPVYRYALRDGQVGWRLMGICGLEGQPYDGVLLDRGLVSQFAGAMTPSAATFPEPGAVVGILRSPGGKPLLGPAETSSAAGIRVFRVLDKAAVASVASQNHVTRPAPYILAVESEVPAPSGVAPAALPEDIPNNHFVYALTWFALAGVLLWFYGAMLIRRLTGR
jgi:surfeit locus 1 family protein